jgi:enoyl-CoA hydratase/carnithine racemase
MSDPTPILSDAQEGVFQIIFNRPSKKNAFTLEMYERIVALLEEATSDDGVRAIVLRGTEGIFTAGNDLKDFLENPPEGPESPVFGLLLGLSRCAKPVVAAVEGPAIGIGTTMLLHCDFVFASESCRFQLPFINLGLTPEGGSTFLLPRMAGDRLARELLMLGEPFSADVAKRAGIATEVVADGQAVPRALSVASKLAAKPAACLRETKSLMKDATRARVEETLHREGDSFIKRLGSPEAREAFTAFLDKRKPDFTRLG